MTAFYSTTAKYALRYLLGTSGRRDVDTGFQSLATDVEAAISAENFPGKIIWTARSTAPNAFYILCDGASLLRTGTYAALFAAIGTTYGSADGTHFSVPDLRGRVMVHPDGTANRLTANDVLGNSGGEEKHVLTQGELPAYAVGMRWSPVTGGVPDYNGTPAGAQGALRAGGDNGSQSSIDVGGSGTSHNNMPPFVILTALIHV